MKVWIVEDSKRVAEELEGAIIRRDPNANIQILPNLAAAVEAIEQITDEDVVLLDSQLPFRVDGGPIAVQAGEEMIARIRAKGLRSKLIWHSRTSLPETARTVGVQDQSLANTAAVAVCVFAESSTSKPFAPETWSFKGQQYLERLTSRQPPFSEFVPLSILCQGYLAIVGAAQLFPNELANDLEQTEIGRKCIAQASAHLSEALNFAQWFAVGREQVSTAVKRAGADEAVYWRILCAGHEDLEPEVATIQRLYESTRAEQQHDAESPEERHRLVAAAHKSLERLFAGRYL